MAAAVAAAAAAAAAVNQQADVPAAEQVPNNFGLWPPLWIPPVVCITKFTPTASADQLRWSAKGMQPPPHDFMTEHDLLAVIKTHLTLNDQGQAPATTEQVVSARRNHKVVARLTYRRAICGDFSLPSSARRGVRVLEECRRPGAGAERAHQKCLTGVSGDRRRAHFDLSAGEMASVICREKPVGPYGLEAGRQVWRTSVRTEDIWKDGLRVAEMTRRVWRPDSAVTQITAVAQIQDDHAGPVFEPDRAGTDATAGQLVW